MAEAHRRMREQFSLQNGSCILPGYIVNPLVG